LREITPSRSHQPHQPRAGWPPIIVDRYPRNPGGTYPRSRLTPGQTASLASIGYHYGSTKALLNAAVLAAMDEFGEEMARAIGEPEPGPGALEPSRLEQSSLERFERFWTRVIDSFQASSQVWLATFDIFTVAQRDPEVRAAVADADEERTRAIGSLHQALVSGVLVQWLIDPGRAPSPAELALGLQAIAEQVAAS